MKSGRGRNGFTLVEILIVLGIIGFAMVSLLVLVSMGVETNRVSAEESGAVNLATSLLGDIRSSPVRGSDGHLREESVRYQLPMPLFQEEKKVLDPLVLSAEGKSGAATGTQYRVEATYHPSGLHQTPANAAPAYVALKITWPAQASGPANLQGAWECVASFPQEGTEWK